MVRAFPAKRAWRWIGGLSGLLVVAIACPGRYLVVAQDATSGSALELSAVEKVTLAIKKEILGAAGPASSGVPGGSVTGRSGSGGGAVVESVERLPVPNAEALRKATGEIKSLLKEEYAAAATADKTTDKELALAKKLRSTAEDTTGDPASRFVLLREAAEWAFRGGDLDAGLDAVRLLASEYEVDGPELAGKILGPVLGLASEGSGTKGAKTTKAPEPRVTDADVRMKLVSGLLDLLEGEIDEDDFERSERLAPVLVAAIDKLPSNAARAKVRARAADVTNLAQAAATLRKKPDDAAANGKLGEYFCLARNLWDNGLPYLAKGNGAELPQLARQDLQKPESVDDRVKLADGWWDAAQSRDAAAKAAMQARAGMWYGKVEENVNGLVKVRVEKRLNTVRQEGAPNMARAGDSGAGGRGSAAGAGKDRVRVLEADAQECRTAEEALLLYKIFLADSKNTAADKAQARGRLAYWEQAARDNLVRVGKKWIPSAEAEKLKAEADKLVDEAFDMLNVRNYAAADDKLEKASKIYPDHLESLFLLAVGAFLHKDYKGSERRFQQCLSRAPLNVPLLNNLAVCDTLLKRFDKAVKYWKKAASLDPESTFVTQNLGRFISDANTKRIGNVDRRVVDEASEVYQQLLDSGKVRRANPSAPYSLVWLMKPKGTQKAPESNVIVGNGSGFVIAEGFVLTNKHVVEDADAVVIQDPENGSGAPLPTRIVSVSKVHDLALLECKQLKAPPTAFHDTPLARGTEVLALGFPITSVVGKGLKATRGIVTGLPNKETGNLLVLDVQVNPGNSGGPLCDRTGRVVGVVSAKTYTERFVQGYGLAIPIGDAIPFVKEHVPNFASKPHADTQVDWTAVDAEVSKSTVMILIQKRR